MADIRRYYLCVKNGDLYVFSQFRNPGAVHTVVNTADGLCPSYCICDNFLHVGVFIGRIGLVTGLEIEHLSSFSYISKTRAENLTCIIPTDKYGFIGSRYTEGLTVGLFTGKLEESAEALSYRMAGLSLRRFLRPERERGGFSASRSELQL